MTKKRKLKVFFIIIPIILLLLILISLLIFYYLPIEKMHDLQSLKNESYDSVFISMYSIENYSPEVFKEYRGLNTNIATHTIKDMDELIEYLDAIFASNNSIDTIYIGLDPYKFYTPDNATSSAFTEQIDALPDYMIDHPNVTFEILLPSPSIDYWCSLDSQQTEDILSSYRYATALFDPIFNVICYWVGHEEWLISNPYNYTNQFAPNALISDKIVRISFCDHSTEVNVDNIQSAVEKLSTLIASQKESPIFYPDLSDKSIVFFGDSILGLDYGSYSIPGVIHGLTNAKVYNYAIGGTTGCDWNTTTDTDQSFTDQLNKFLNQENFYTGDNTQFPYGKIASEDMIFVINYGFNDFITNISPEFFYNTLDSEISRLQSAYPESQIIIMVPHENIYAGSGTACANNNGIFLFEYANSVRQLASTKELTLLDVPALMDVDEANHTKYFRDGCHYNEYGRFLLAQHIITVIE